MKTKEHVTLQQLIVFGAGGLIPIALFNIAGQLVGLIGNISLGLSAFWLGVILIIPRVWDAVSDPIVGHFSDNTHTRWGRRRPFVLFGGIAVALSFVMMWWVPKHQTFQAMIPSESAFQWFQLFYILVSVLVFFTACTVFEIPHGALGMEMTPDSHERTRLFSAKSFFGNMFAMATPWLFALAGMEIFKGPGGSEADGMRYVSILVAIFLIPASFWWFFTLKEPKAVEIKTKETQERSKFWTDMKYIIRNRNFLYLVVTVFTLAMGFNFVSLLNYYISIFYIYGGDKAAAGPLLGINGTIWAVTGLLAVFPLNWLSPRLGKRETLIVSIALMCAAQFAKIFCYDPQHPYLVVIPTVLLSAGMLFFFTLSTSMLGDVCDEDDLKTGKRAEGSYYSVYWWFIKMGSAFASVVTGILILATQFDETQVTRADELRGSINEVRAELQVSQSDEKPALISTESQSKLIRNFEKNSEDLEIQARKLGSPESSEILNRNSVRIEQLKKLTLEAGQLSPDAEASGLKNFHEQVRRLALELKIDRADLKALAMKEHFVQAGAHSPEDSGHHEMLMKNLDQVHTGLQSLVVPGKTIDAQNVERTLPSFDAALSSVTQQTPRSLFMMRLIEISLPILLSLISLLFALKYPLTNEKCAEIQQALRKRNEQVSGAKA